ncbi:MAG: hypothetical protein ABL951_04115 [Alphaproteobacteria bacterium]
MQEINLLLESDEIGFLRLNARMMALFNPEGNEMVEQFITKVLSATDEFVSDEQRKEIGKLQRAIKSIRNKPLWPMLIAIMKELEMAMIEEMKKEENS